MKLLPLILFAVVTHALVFVSILAPGALLVDGKSVIHRNITAPKLDPVALPTNTNSLWWYNIAKYYMANDPFASWNLPIECSWGCAFEVTYQAPGISCRQTSEQETPLKPFDLQLYESGQEWDFYWSNSTFEMTWGTNNLPLNFSLVPMISQISSDGDLISVNQTGPIQGQLCEFHDKIYRAHFNYTDNAKIGTLEVISETNDFTQTCSWTSGNSLSPDCSHYASAATNMSLGYISNLYFRAGWNISDNSLPLELFHDIPFFNLNFSSDGLIISFTPSDNLSQELEDNFANVVLGILLQLDQTELASAEVIVGNVWLFTPLVLWMTYIPALFLVLVAGLWGLRWAYRGNIVREKNFSSFLIATRTKNLDFVCAQYSDVVMSTKLQHDAQTGRFLVLNDGVDKSLSYPGGFSGF
jgi:hypothetical protein